MKTKISVYTQKLEDKPYALYLKQIEDAAKIADKHQANLLVLPGYSIGNGVRNTPSIDAVCKDIQTIVDSENIAILAEVGKRLINNNIRGMTRYFAPKEPEHAIKEQLFINSSETTPKAVQDLISEFRNGSRIFTTGGKRFGVLLCGENNIITHERVNNNKPFLRHADVGWFWDYDVLLNPTHTLMGQSNLMHRRFEYLSQGNRTVIHCACDTSKSNNAKRAIYVYQNGELLVQGDLTNKANFPTYIGDNWRLITVELS